MREREKERSPPALGKKLLTRTRGAAPKKPINKLPESIEISPETNVEEVKKIIARQTGLGDFNRVGLFDPSTQKTLKNRKAQIASEQAVMSAGQVLVKDLGASAPLQLLIASKD